MAAEAGAGPMLPRGLRARYDHTAIASARIRDLLPLYQQLLGGVAVRGGDNVGVGYRAVQLELADQQRIELLEPLPGSRFFEAFFARTGGGVHHLTFAVEDIGVALDVIRASPYEPIHLSLDGPGRPELFLHPKQAHGCLIQIIQPVPRTRPAVTIEQVLAGRGTYGTGEPSP